MVVNATRRIAACFTFTLSVALALTLFVAQTGATYPDAGGGYEGWTAEEVVGALTNPHHVQVAHGGGYLYTVADNGNTVWFYRTANEDNLNLSYMCALDTVGTNAARNAYIDASGDYVVVSWNERIGGIWSLVIKLSLIHI